MCKIPSQIQKYSDQVCGFFSVFYSVLRAHDFFWKLMLLHDYRFMVYHYTQWQAQVWSEQQKLKQERKKNMTDSKM